MIENVYWVGFGPPFCCVLPDAENAMKYQDKVYDTQLGPYNKMKNSCVDHVCEVLRQGGVDVPKSVTRQIKFLRSVGLF